MTKKRVKGEPTGKTHLKSLRKVHDLQPSSRLKLGEIQQELVSDQTFRVAEPKLVGALEPLGDVVGVEDRNLCRVGEPFTSEHLDESPRLKPSQEPKLDTLRDDKQLRARKTYDREDGGTTPRGRRDGFDSLFTPRLDDRVARQERSKVLSNTDRANSWSSSTVRTDEKNKMISYQTAPHAEPWSLLTFQKSYED